MKKLILISLIALISSCQNSQVDYTYPENQKNIRIKRAGKFFDNKNLFSTETKTPQKQIIANKLWISSIEVISTLLPIDVADESSGLIITQWYQSEAGENERIKINLLVKGSEPKKENLVLTIFGQKKSNNGWIDDKKNRQSLSAQMIKDKIIEKAKNDK